MRRQPPRRPNIRSRRPSTGSGRRPEALEGRRGSAYIAILGAATVVMVIGLSALWVARIGARAGSANQDAAKARFYAQSVADVALFRIASDPDWRTTYVHDTWTANETVAEYTLSFKLADEADGDLANDASQPVRLYAKASVGRATRVYSVLLQAPESPNLLTNHDMENGTTDWSAMRCTIQSSTSNPHSGAACLEMTDGEASGSGPQQYVDEVIENGVTYYIQVWARKASGTSYVRIALAIESSGEGKVFFEDPNDDTYVDTAWTKCTARLTPTWSGTLDAARVKFTVPSGTYDMLIDDAVMIEQRSGQVLTIVPGTWRQESLP